MYVHGNCCSLLLLIWNALGQTAITAKCDYSSYEKPSIQTSKENVADSNEVKAMPHWILQPNQRTVLSHVIHCRLMTRCKINDVDCYDVSGELRVGSGKVWTIEQRVDISFVRVCERKGCLSLAMPTGQITSKRAQGWCCLVVPWSAEKCQNTNMPCVLLVAIMK